MKSNILIEIGTEEIPSLWLEPAAKQFFDKIIGELSEYEISFDSGEYFYSPRRIGIILKDIDEKAKDKTVEEKGPPSHLAFKDGKPLPQAIGFAKSKGIEVNKLLIKDTEKGKFAFAVKRVKGKKTRDILSKFLPEIIKGIEFPKTMKWDNTGIRFARPIRWITALMKDKVIKFNFGNITSGRYTYGHRFLSNGRIKLRDAEEYANAMKNGFVIFNPKKRREIIEKALTNYAKSVGAEVVNDEDLLRDVVNLVEFPEVISGKFDKKYLILPEDVIITAMKVHQRYFALRKNKKLLNQFLAVINTHPNKKIIQGNENVLRARLEDALFYWNIDKEKRLKNRIDDLKNITWLQGVGTMYDKTLRISQLSQFLCSKINGCREKLVTEIASLSKVDLTTHMIRDGKEFTGLEGIIGMEYAISEGIDEEIARGIFEHRLPRFPGDKLPSKTEYIVLSICDRIDTIATAFILNKIPSGSKDPLGIRRDGNAVVETLMNKNIHISMELLIKEAVRLLNGNSQIQKEIIAFLSQRAKTYLLNSEIRYDIADAVIKSGIDDIRDIYLKAHAISEMRLNSRNFTKLVIGQKRVANILKGITKFSQIDKILLQENAEKALYKYIKENSDTFDKFISNRDYSAALNILLNMRKYIDKFFDDVLVMTDEMKSRGNRLALLHNLREIFLKVADFSLIVIEGDEKKI